MKKILLPVVLIIFLLIGPGSSSANSLFSEQQIIDEQLYGIQFIYTADIDGDKLNDVISAYAYEGKVVWYKYENGVFSENPISSDEDYLPNVQAAFPANLDGDKDVDIIVISSSEPEKIHNIVWYENKDGNGTDWQPHEINNDTKGASSVFAIDMDNDEDIDVVVALHYENKILWYENKLNETDQQWDKHLIVKDVSNPKGIFAIDINNDGYVDWVAAALKGSNKIMLYINKTKTIPLDKDSWEKQTISSSTYQARSVFAIDFDGDGDVDLISGSMDPDGIVLYKNTSENNNEVVYNPSWETIVLPSLPDVTSVYAADVNDNGLIDIVAASYRDTFAWYESLDENNNFDQHILAEDTQVDKGYAVNASDLDGDGDLDILSASRDDGKIAWYENLSAPILKIDIKPSSCPNPLNTKSKGVLPVAILGTDTFDITKIDPSSIRLADVSPIRSSFEDVATPFDILTGGDETYFCNDYGPDGFTDLTLKFNTQDIVEAMGEVNDGDVLELMLTGSLLDGTSFEGSDFVIIKKKGK